MSGSESTKKSASETIQIDTVPKTQKVHGDNQEAGQVRETFKVDMEGVNLSFKDILDCPICFLTIDSVPLYQCLNGHVVCKDCHPKLENCPICRDEKCYNPKLGICREDKHFNLKVRNRKLEEIIKRYCRHIRQRL